MATRKGHKKPCNPNRLQGSDFPGLNRPGLIEADRDR